MRTLSHTLLALAAVSVCLPAGAGMYRWVDEDGVTVYSQTPPPTAPALRMQKQPGPSPQEQEAARERLRTGLEQSMDAREERKRAEQEQAKLAEERAVQEQNCAAARKNFETMQNLGTRMVRMPDGNVVRLSEQQVEDQKGKAQRQIEKYCD